MASSNYPQGSKQNPHNYGTYIYLTDENRWNGGWVIDGSFKYYIDGHDYKYLNEGPDLGSSTNTPYPFHVYQEMVSNGTWTGGYVLKPGGVVEYEESIWEPADGSGSGSGSGSDSGSGSGSGSGSNDEGGNNEEEENTEEEETEEGCGCGDTYINIGEGSTRTLAIDSTNSISFEVQFNWTTGRYNTRTKNCTSKITVEMIDCDCFGDNVYIDESFRGSATWLTPLTLQYLISYKYHTLTNTDTAINASLSYPVAREGEGC